jgi:hypothetical protein
MRNLLTYSLIVLSFVMMAVGCKTMKNKSLQRSEIDSVGKSEIVVEKTTTEDIDTVITVEGSDLIGWIGEDSVSVFESEEMKVTVTQDGNRKKIHAKSKDKKVPVKFNKKTQEKTTTKQQSDVKKETVAKTKDKTVKVQTGTIMAGMCVALFIIIIIWWYLKKSRWMS